MGRIRDKFRGRDKAKGIRRAGPEKVPAEGPVILWCRRWGRDQADKGSGNNGAVQRTICSKIFHFKLDALVSPTWSYK